MKRIRRGTVVLIASFVSASAQGPDTFVAVHLEPDHTAYYNSLIGMVALADSFHAFLTLQFNPQWADTILGNPVLVNQVRGWQKKGHEIAAHHHAVSYGVGGWDGYTNRPASDYPNPVKYRGNMQAYFTLLSLLAGDSLLRTGCITDPEYDWPTGILFRTEGHNVTESVSRPALMVYNGQPVTSLGFGLINTRQRVDSAKTLYNAASSKDVVGVVLHEKDFTDNRLNLKSWLQFLQDKGKPVKTVRQILRERGYATAVPDDRRFFGPGGMVLYPSFPNPFNASATIRFVLHRSSAVRLDLADANGRTVRNLLRKNMDAGDYSIRLEAGDLPSGMYFAVLNAEGIRLVRKAVLTR